MGVFGDWSPIRSFSVRYPLCGTYTASGYYVADVWVKDDLAYLTLVGWNQYLQIVSVSDPSSPQLISNLEISDSSYPLVIVVAGDYAYLADYYGGLHVVDISDPGQPRQIGYCEAAGGRDISVAGDYLCCAGGYPDLQLIDVSCPEEPAVIGCYNGPGQCDAVSAQGDYAYLACETAGLRIVQLQATPSGTYLSQVGSCEDLDGAVDVFVKDNCALVADALTGLQIVEVSDPSSPGVVGGCEIRGARSVCVSSSYACIGDYDGVLRIVDISQLSSPAVMGSYRPLGSLRGVFADGGRAYLAYGEAGLDIISIE